MVDTDRSTTPAQTSERSALEALKARISDLLDEMWERIGKHHVSVSGRALGGLTPSADVGNDEKTYAIEVELPGVDPKDIEVLQRGETIVVRGEKHVTREKSGRDYTICERLSGHFIRSFPLPPDADPSKAEARLVNGLLTITVPIRPDARKPARRVPIKAA